MPQANDKYKTSLDALRDEIDVLDREIVDLLLKRSEIVAKVGNLKQEEKVSGSYIRPRREAVMLRNLIAAFEGTRFPPAAVTAIWRTIIGASTSMESPLNLSVLLHEGEDASPYFLAREYFGSFLPSVLHTEASALFGDLARNPHTIGILPLSSGAAVPCWWEILAEIKGDKKPVVFAHLPFIHTRHSKNNPPPSLAAGRVEILPTGDDHSVMVLRADKPMKAEQWRQSITESFAAPDMTPAWHIVAPSGRSALAGIPGFHYHQTLPALPRMEAVCLGAYATPYLLT